MEIAAPTSTNVGMVEHDEIHDVCELPLAELAPVVGKNTSSVARQPNPCGIARMPALRDVDVHRFPVLCRPEGDGKTLEEEQPRHTPSTPPARVEG